MFRRPGPYVEVHHAGHPWLGFLLLLLLVAALVLAALTFWRTSRQPVGTRAPVAPPPPPPAAPPRDPALAELRLRYARGEIDRDEYLQRANDLGDLAPAAPPPQPDGAG